MVVLAVEALSLLVFAGFDLAAVRHGQVVLAVGTTMFFVGYAGLQLATGWALWTLRSWGRAPAVFTQLVQLGLAWGLRETAPPLSGLLTIAAAVVLFGVLSAPSRRALADAGTPEAPSHG
ncbi:UNVERIFIED_CONTAM: hypothetical protein LK11_13405 [Mumia flava]